MKRVSLILISREKKDFLTRFQKLGVLEIIKQEEKTNKALEEKLELLSKVKRTIVELRREKKKYKNQALSPANNTRKKINPEEILLELDSLNEQLIDVSREIDKHEIDKRKLMPWGDFNMEEVKRLEERNIKTHFYIIPVNKFKHFDAEGLLCEIVHRDKSLVYFIVVSYDKIESDRRGRDKSVADEVDPFEGLSREEILKKIPMTRATLPIEIKKKKEGLIKSIQAYETHLPQESLTLVDRKIEEKKEAQKNIENQIKSFIGYIEILTEFSTTLANSIQFDEAEMYCEKDDTGALTLIDAWFSESEEKKVVELLNSFTLRYTISEPQKSENPPVILRNNPLVRPFEVITRIFSLPSYFEMDPTPLFAPFFMLFFGLCIADIGYAILLLGIALFGYFRVDESLKPAFKLGIILGTFTLVTGYWLNTFMGFYIYENQGIEKSLIRRDIAGDFLSPYIINGKQVFPAISFSILVGFLQVSFAMLMHMMNQMKQSGIKHAVKPFSYLLLVYGSVIAAAHHDILGLATMKIGSLYVGQIILLAPINVAYALLGGGFFLALFLNNPEKKIWARPPLALWDLYEFISGIVGDILSYLRLFALGLASGLLGEAYNTIAFLVLDGLGGWHSVFGVTFFTLIFVAGHLLNIILAVIGAFVHSLRLTFVEFYKNLHFHGGGKPFTPFTLVKSTGEK
jgi:V/A-type H+-transporting ATPase subunit I